MLILTSVKYYILSKESMLHNPRHLVDIEQCFVKHTPTAVYGLHILECRNFPLAVGCGCTLQISLHKRQMVPVTS